MLPRTPLVSLVLVTRRPSFLPEICGMLQCQTYAHTELVVALHGHKVMNLLPDERLALESASLVLELPGDCSLGSCLNSAVEKSSGQFVTKVDDDDLYGRNYLAELIEHLLAGDGDVIGKAEYYVYLQDSGSIVLISPGLGLKTVKFIRGGTLAFSRSLALQCPFRDVALGEDNAFLEDCRLAGATIYSTSRRNYMYFRYTAKHAHTSQRPDIDFIESGIVLRRNRPATRAELLALIDEKGA
jgi:hypothetical protein